MKLSLAILSAALGLASAGTSKKIKTKIGSRKLTADTVPQSSVSATSKVGEKVMSKARRLDDNDEIDYTWVANMSLKFQGCYHTQQWNEDADGDEDVRISTQRLVRFRLCPSDTCSMESAAGCSEGYGDYIIGMDDYLAAYFEAVQQDQEYSCEYEKEYGDCICDGENADDGFDEEICEYDCYMAKGMEYCVDNNPYNDDEEEEEEEWELEEMAECRNYEFDNNDNRRLEEEEEVEYFVGAYCSENGGNIYLGLFTEETCSQFADEYGGRETFAAMSYGKSLPYSDSTMIGTECMSCKEPQDANDDNNGDDDQDADEVKEGCEQLYEAAGKCEGGLSGTVAYPNNYACNFMQGIKIVRKNGAIVRGAGTQNTTASVFIGLFACSFVLFGGYVYYLKTKLDRAKINLSE
eukprot:CAMPEP_0201636378 /NCGR_PEP_ID=MMETSP0493-20130528/8560_1 /ASSEMBLY_ACC=CAM_ASM_000838 /TAXON_ID=420259 /ORGANISM="Thalassiosira gravida, Strain GMp14c1" /LENGTH=407 /DNA_ID=CAMNT_0048108469 /DNA_START=56 /DNA_END=1279 /DNA_ORIENTATION=+